MKTSEAPVRVEQIFNTAPVTLWDALTKVDRMRKWYFDNIPDFEARVGFETHFTVNSGTREFSHYWLISEVQPLHKIAYYWWYAGYRGKAIASFELFDSSAGTGLQVTMTVLEDFPDEIPEFTRESCLGGWNYFIKDRLKKYTESIDNI